MKEQINSVLIPAIFILLLLIVVIGSSHLAEIQRQLDGMKSNQIEIIENQKAIGQDGFHSDE